MKIIELISIIKSKTNMIPLVIFKYTATYHKTLEKYLQKNNIPYHIVAPLRAAKSHQNDIRSVKTDKRDYLSLARMFYDIKNDSLGKFREHLSVIYPNYKITDSNPNGAFKHVYSKELLGFLKEFPHPELVVSKIDE